MKKIILVGGSDGLGKEFVKLCVNKNIQIVNLSRTPSDVDGVVNIKCDLSDEKQVEMVVEEIKAKHSNFDAVVNCAAIVAMEKIDEITYEKFERAWKINTISPLYMLSLLFDTIVKNEADILNVGTTAILKEGYENQLAYMASKSGLLGGSKNFRLELKNTKTRVIHAHVGGMNTKMHEKDYGAKIEDPSVWMKPAEVAGVLLYLLELPKQIEISEIMISRKKA